MERLIAVTAGFALVPAVLTYLLSIGFPQYRYVKYGPALLCLVIALYNFVVAPNAPTEGFKQLGHVIYAMIATGCFVVSLVVAIFLDRRR
ncbi:MAG: hypothetical protein ACM3ZQ_10125 [Bacillota bacterium]